MNDPLLELVRRRHPKDPRGTFVSYSDGVQVWEVEGYAQHLERYTGEAPVPDWRRKWCIVDRRSDDYDELKIEPPLIAGPFRSSKLALIALDLIGEKNAHNP